MGQKGISWKHLIIHTLVIVAVHGLYLVLASQYYWAEIYTSRDYTLYMWMVIFFLDIFGKHHAGSALLAGHLIFVFFAPLYHLYVRNRKGITIKQVGDLLEYSCNGVVYDPRDYYMALDSGSFYICCVVVALIVNAVRRSGKEI